MGFCLPNGPHDLMILSILGTNWPQKAELLEKYIFLVYNFLRLIVFMSCQLKVRFSKWYIRVNKWLFWVNWKVLLASMKFSIKECRIRQCENAFHCSDIILCWSRVVGVCFLYRHRFDTIADLGKKNSITKLGLGYAASQY